MDMCDSWNDNLLVHRYYQHNLVVHRIPKNMVYNDHFRIEIPLD